jgi:hypothetical protein
MSTNLSSYSMPGMAHASSSVSGKTVKPVEANTESVEVNSDSYESTSEMVIKPFEELSNPQGYIFFSPF